VFLNVLDFLSWLNLFFIAVEKFQVSLNKVAGIYDEHGHRWFKKTKCLPMYVVISFRMPSFATCCLKWRLIYLEINHISTHTMLYSFQTTILWFVACHVLLLPRQWPTHGTLT
jgi:hypothetical protein